MTRPKVEAWASEAAMFASFVEAVKPLGWTAYPECCGHDLILRAGPEVQIVGDLQHGDTVAVEGKLRPTIEVLAQAMPPDRDHWWRHRSTGADWYAVLVPGADARFRELAEALGILVIEWAVRDGGERWGTRERSWFRSLGHWPGSARVCLQPLKLPDVVVDMPAGMPSPRSVTPWKLAAVRLCLGALDRPGREVRASEFKSAEVNHRTFVDRGWMRLVRRDGREGVFELLDPREETTEHGVRFLVGAGRPDLAYPEIAAAIRAEARR